MIVQYITLAGLAVAMPIFAEQWKTVRIFCVGCDATDDRSKYLIQIKFIFCFIYNFMKY